MGRFKSSGAHVVRRYLFEVREELITHVEVMADSEREARDRILMQGQDVTPFETIHSDPEFSLKAVSDY